jgi:hypothetical protein
MTHERGHFPNSIGSRCRLNPRSQAADVVNAVDLRGKVLTASEIVPTGAGQASVQLTPSGEA